MELEGLFWLYQLENWILMGCDLPGCEYIRESPRHGSSFQDGNAVPRCAAILRMELGAAADTKNLFPKRGNKWEYRGTERRMLLFWKQKTIITPSIKRCLTERL